MTLFFFNLLGDYCNPQHRVTSIATAFWPPQLSNGNYPLEHGTISHGTRGCVELWDTSKSLRTVFGIIGQHSNKPHSFSIKLVKLWPFAFLITSLKVLMEECFQSETDNILHIRYLCCLDICLPKFI